MLYILPNLLDSELSVDEFLPPITEKIVASLDGLVAESEKGGRRFLAKFLHRDEFSKIEILILNEHSSKEDLDEIVETVARGGKWGLVSDCGMPCIADPGSDLIFSLREKSVKLHAIMGPSSIMHALVLSGLNAQQFSFHGYLPREIKDLKVRLLELQRVSQKEGSTQMWIERALSNF